jgi:hypothetical protein
LKSIQIYCSSAFFAIQPIRDAWGRFTKRPRANSPPFQASNNDSFGENGDYSLKSHRERLRKASQLFQFGVYQNQIPTSDSPDSDAPRKPTPVIFEPQFGKIWPHISVDIPFRSKNEANLHQNKYKKPSKIGDQKPLTDLLKIIINRF